MIMLQKEVLKQWIISMGRALRAAISTVERLRNMIMLQKEVLTRWVTSTGQALRAVISTVEPLRNMIRVPKVRRHHRPKIRNIRTLARQSNLQAPLFIVFPMTFWEVREPDRELLWGTAKAAARHLAINPKKPLASTNTAPKQCRRRRRKMATIVILPTRVVPQAAEVMNMGPLLHPGRRRAKWQPTTMEEMQQVALLERQNIHTRAEQGTR
jgi:hypothetical protein